MTGRGQEQRRVQLAIEAVRGCAEAMELHAASFQRAVPESGMEAELQAAVMKVCATMSDTAGRVQFELVLLQPQVAERKATIATLVGTLANLDASLMKVIDEVVEVAAQLEGAAERDDVHEPIYVQVMQAARQLLRTVGTARTAAEVVKDEDTAARERLRSAKIGSVPLAPSHRVAADGSVVVLEVGAEGGSLTLVGRPVAGGQWQFARVTDDQTEALFGEYADGVVRAPSLENLAWVDSWEEGLRLLDRYRWARLYPLAVHPEFVERVRAAVEERLVQEDVDVAERARGKWERLFKQTEVGRT